MADIYTPLANAQNSGTLQGRANGDLLTGNVRWAQCSYTTTGSTAAGDKLFLCKLPKGAVVIPGLSFIDTEDCGTDINITIGDDIPVEDVDKYSTAISLATAGRVAFVPGVAGPNPAPLTQEAWIKGTIGNAGSIAVTSGADFTVWLAYRLP